MRRLCAKLLVCCMVVNLLTFVSVFADTNVSDSTVPDVVIRGGLVRFGASYMDSTVGYTVTEDELGENAPVTIDNTIKAYCKESGSNLTSGGIRNNGDYNFQVPLANSYILVSYWVKAVLNSEAEIEKPQVQGYLQYSYGTGFSGGDMILNSETLTGAQTLEEDKWYKCMQLFKVETPTPGSDGCKDNLRFALYCANKGQTTFVGDAVVYNFGTDFEFGGITDTVEAIKAYINSSSLKSISCDGTELPDFSADRLNYTLRLPDGTETVPEISASTATIFSDCKVDRPSAIPGNVCVTVNAYDSDTLNPCGEYGHSTAYNLWLTNIDENVAVESVTLNKTEVTLDVGASEQVIATVKPDNASNKDVVWSTSDNNIATVSNTGVITGVAHGEAVITVVTDDGGATASCTVVVNEPEIDYAPVLITNDMNNLFRFQSGYFNPELTKLVEIDDADSPVDSAFRYVCTEAATTTLTSGIRHISGFQVKEAGSYVAAAYWVKAEFDDTVPEGTLPVVCGRMRYIKEDTTTSGDYISGGSDTTLPSDGKWYRRYQIFKVETPTGSDDTASLRFILGAAAIKGQTTYIGGLEIYRFKAGYSYGNETDSIQAIKNYISDASLKDVFCGGNKIEDFEPNVFGYVVSEAYDAVNPPEVSAKKASIFADIRVENAESIPGTAVMCVQAYDADDLTEYKSYSKTKQYSVYIKKEDAITIDSGVITHGGLTVTNPKAGENKVNLTVTNSGSATTVGIAVLLYDKTTGILQELVSAETELANGTSQQELTVTAPTDNCLIISAIVSENGAPLADSVLISGETVPVKAITPKDGDITVVQNFENGTLEVTGKLAGEFPQRFLAVAGTEEGISDGKCTFAYVLRTDKNGNIGFVLVPAAIEDNTEYVMYFIDELSEAVTKVPYYWYSDEVMSSAVRWFENASESDVSEALKSMDSLVNGNVRAAVLFGNALDLYLALENKAIVDKALSGSSFDDVLALRAAFASSISAAQICQEYELISDVDEFSEFIINNSTALNIVMDNSYGYPALSESEKASVYTKVKKLTYENSLELFNNINEQIMLTLFNGLAWGDYRKATEFYADKLELDLNGDDYKKLSDSKKIALYKSLSSKDFTALADLTKKFKELVAELNKDENLVVVGGGGTGGGGGAISTGGGMNMYSPSYGNDNTNTSSDSESINDRTDVFSDLADAAWAESYIVDLYSKDIVSGDGDGKFRPNDYLTRAEFVKMIVNAFELDKIASVQADFSDCTENDWYYPYVSAACGCGVVIGREDGSFGANETITREDMAVISYRAVNAVNKALPDITETEQFADGAEISDYAKEAITAMQRAQIINGVGGGRFSPGELSTRAMAAKVISLLMKL